MKEEHDNYYEQFEELVVEMLYLAADSKNPDVGRVLRKAAALLDMFNKAICKSVEESKKDCPNKVN